MEEFTKLNEGVIISSYFGSENSPKNATYSELKSFCDYVIEKLDNSYPKVTFHSFRESKIKDYVNSLPRNIIRIGDDNNSVEVLISGHLNSEYLNKVWNLSDEENSFVRNIAENYFNKNDKTLNRVIE